MAVSRCVLLLLYSEFEIQPTTENPRLWVALAAIDVMALLLAGLHRTQ
jgi:hypothetical protein